MVEVCTVGCTKFRVIYTSSLLLSGLDVSRVWYQLIRRSIYHASYCVRKELVCELGVSQAICETLYRKCINCVKTYFPRKVWGMRGMSGYQRYKRTSVGRKTVQSSSTRLRYWAAGHGSGTAADFSAWAYLKVGQLFCADLSVSFEPTQTISFTLWHFIAWGTTEN